MIKANFILLLTINAFCILLTSCTKNDIIDSLEFTSKSEKNQYENYINYFNRLSWKYKSGGADITNINTFIDSCNGMYSEYPIKVMIPVLVHRITEIGAKENLYEWDFFRNLLLDSNKLSDDEYDKYLLSKIDASKLRIKNSQFSHYHSYHDDILEALIIRQCKILRKGETQNIELADSLLNNFQKLELKYAKFPDQIAIDSLILEIANKEVNGHNLIWVLKQYNGEATKKVTEFILNEDRITNTGKSNFLYFLINRIKLDLTQNEQYELLDFLMNKSTYKDKFKNQLAAIVKINHQITGKSIEASKIELGIDVKKEKEIQRIYEEKQKKEIERLQQEIKEKQNRRQ